MWLAFMPGMCYWCVSRTKTAQPCLLAYKNCKQRAGFHRILLLNVLPMLPGKQGNPSEDYQELQRYIGCSDILKCSRNTKGRNRSCGSKLNIGCIKDVTDKSTMTSLKR